MAIETVLKQATNDNLLYANDIVLESNYFDIITYKSTKACYKKKKNI